MKQVRTIAALAVSLLLGAGGPAAAQSGDAIRVIDFPSATSLPLYIAQDQGFFEKQGVKVNLVHTAGSEEQMGDLIEGKYDVAATALDNVIAYQAGQSGEKAPARTPDLIAFMGSVTVDLPVVVAPEIKTFEDLRGKKLAVDSPHTGYALLLRGLLEKNGLKDGDYGFVQAGGSSKRWEAIQKKEAAGGLLNATTEARAKSAGFHVLARTNDLLADYPGSVYTTTRTWAKAHPEELVKFIRAYREGLDWLHDPANREKAAAILAKTVGNLTPKQASDALNEMMTPPGGYIRDARLNPQAVEIAITLRSKYGVPKKELGKAADYADMSYFERAVVTR
jgi:ABC-type nitrate/sulfonate/bicarbonate transport system substrate-binding protein